MRELLPYCGTSPSPTENFACPAFSVFERSSCLEIALQSKVNVRREVFSRTIKLLETGSVVAERERKKRSKIRQSRELLHTCASPFHDNQQNLFSSLGDLLFLPACGDSRCIITWARDTFRSYKLTKVDHIAVRRLADRERRIAFRFWHHNVPRNISFISNLKSSLIRAERIQLETKVDFEVTRRRNSCICPSFKPQKLSPAFAISRYARSGYFGSSDEVLRRTVKSWNRRKVRVNAEGGNRSWWKRFLFEPVDSDTLLDPEFDTRDDGVEVLDDSSNIEDFPAGREEYKDEVDRMLEDDKSFNSWKRRSDAASELQSGRRDPGNKDWEDWLDDSWGDYSNYIGGKDSGWFFSQSDWEKDGLPRDPPKIPTRGMNRTLVDYLMRIFDRQEEVEDDLAFEDRVFQFTSQSTAKFVAVLILLPWLVDFVTHDFVIVPFLNRYVETVPLAAQILDVRESQKLKMIHKLKLERQRVRFEAAIGKAPPLSDDEFAEHIRHEARELREEMRFENRKSFGNIWSDLVAGITLLLLLIFNPKQVAIMRLTGTRVFTNVSDTGKAFIIILLSDIFLGYHSESGWETVIEMFLDHYSFEVDQASIYIFVAIVPVTIDACFKLWVFRYLTRFSPSAVATFREMKRH